MPDFPIDPELRIRGSLPRVLRRTTEAMAFIQKMTLSRSGRAWRDVQQSFEDAWDEWSAMEGALPVSSGVCPRLSLMTSPRSAVDQPTITGRSRLTQLSQPKATFGYF
jgi:hypothetical protein